MWLSPPDKAGPECSPWAGGLVKSWREAPTNLQTPFPTALQPDQGGLYLAEHAWFCHPLEGQGEVGTSHEPL